MYICKCIYVKKVNIQNTSLFNFTGILNLLNAFEQGSLYLIVNEKKSREIIHYFFRFLLVTRFLGIKFSRKFLE